MSTLKLFGILFICMVLIFLVFFRRPLLLKLFIKIKKGIVQLFNPQTYLSQLSIVILGIFLGLQANEIFHEKKNHKNIVKHFAIMDAEMNNNFENLIQDKKKLEEILNKTKPKLDQFQLLLDGKDYVLQNEFQSLYLEFIDILQEFDFRLMLAYMTDSSFDSLLNDDRFDLIDDLEYRTSLSNYLAMVKIYNNNLDINIKKIGFRLPGSKTITGKKRSFNWEEIEGIYLTFNDYFNKILYIKNDINYMIESTVDFNKQLEEYKNKIKRYHDKKY